MWYHCLDSEIYRTNTFAPINLGIILQRAIKWMTLNVRMNNLFDYLKKQQRRIEVSFCGRKCLRIIFTFVLSFGNYHSFFLVAVRLGCPLGHRCCRVSFNTVVICMRFAYPDVVMCWSSKAMFHYVFLRWDNQQNRSSLHTNCFSWFLITFLMRWDDTNEYRIFYGFTLSLSLPLIFPLVLCGFFSFFFLAWNLALLAPFRGIFKGCFEVAESDLGQGSGGYGWVLQASGQQLTGTAGEGTAVSGDGFAVRF